MFGFFNGKKDKAFLERLKNAERKGITSMRVVGRGALTMDPAELAHSESFKKTLRETSKLIEN